MILKNIFLSNKNPRFVDDVPFYTNGKIFRSEQILEDSKTMKLLLRHEGNFSNILTLFRSISEEYDEALQKVFVIDYKNNEKRKIVVEGNRRIIVLKSLNGLIEFPESSDNLQIFQEDEEYSFKSINQENEKIDKQEINKNIKEIHKIIENYNSNKEFEISVEEIQQKDEEKGISNAIYTNHLPGLKKGKRNWSRGQTLKIYKKWWEELKKNNELDDDKIINLISKKTYRNESDVRRYLRSAGWIDFLIKNSLESEDFTQKFSMSGLEIQYVKKFGNYPF